MPVIFCLDYLDYSHLRYPAVLYTWPAPRRRLARRFVGPVPVSVPKGNAQLLCNPLLLLYFILYNVMVIVTIDCTYIGLLYHQLEIGIRFAYATANELQVIGSFPTRLLRVAAGNVEGTLTVP